MKLTRTPKTLPMYGALCASVALVFSGPDQLRAQEMPRGFFGVGAGWAPDYEGSEDYEAVPFVAAQIPLGQFALDIAGTGARVDLSSSPTLGFGPVLEYRFGRNDDVENDQVAEMEEIDDAVELGFFLRAARSPGWAANDEYAIQIDVLTDVSDVHSGSLAEISAEYAFRPTPRLGLSVGVSSTYVTEEFSETYYSVSAADAVASGFDTYEAGEGFKDVGISLGANYALSEHWNAIGTVSVTQLIGDAADSPIVEDAGSETQSFIGLGLAYSF